MSPVRNNTDRHMLNISAGANKSGLRLNENWLSFKQKANIRQAHHQSFVHRYPLGEPGRLKCLYKKSSVACVMIASLPFKSDVINISGDIFDIFSEIPGVESFFQAIPNGIVADGGMLRHVQRADVIDIATMEFPTQPTIILFFESLARSISGQAYFWRMFPTTTGEEGFFVRFARYRLQNRNGSRIEPLKMRVFSCG
jgi:hypothetical protein